MGRPQRVKGQQQGREVLSGPRARLYLPAEEVVAARGRHSGLGGDVKQLPDRTELGKQTKRFIPDQNMFGEARHMLKNPKFGSGGPLLSQRPVLPPPVRKMMRSNVRETACITKGSQGPAAKGTARSSAGIQTPAVKGTVCGSAGSRAPAAGSRNVPSLAVTLIKAAETFKVSQEHSVSMKQKQEYVGKEATGKEIGLVSQKLKEQAETVKNMSAKFSSSSVNKQAKVGPEMSSQEEQLVYLNLKLKQEVEDLNKEVVKKEKSEDNLLKALNILVSGDLMKVELENSDHMELVKKLEQALNQARLVDTWSVRKFNEDLNINEDLGGEEQDCEDEEPPILSTVGGKVFTPEIDLTNSQTIRSDVNKVGVTTTQVTFQESLQEDGLESVSSDELEEEIELTTELVTELVRATYSQSNKAYQSKTDSPIQPKTDTPIQPKIDTPIQPKAGESAKVALVKVQVRIYGEQEQHKVSTLASSLLPMDSLQQLLPEAGTLGSLKYRQQGGRGWRSVVLEGDCFLPPKGGWQDRHYVLFPTAGNASSRKRFAFFGNSITPFLMVSPCGWCPFLPTISPQVCSGPGLCVGHPRLHRHDVPRHQQQEENQDPGLIILSCLLKWMCFWKPIALWCNNIRVNPTGPCLM